MYEISPYATFSVTGGRTVVQSHSKTPTRSAHTPSSLDYTMQFKTFGHPEGDLNATAYPILPSSGFGHVKGKSSWHKQRYYNTDGNKFLLICVKIYLIYPPPFSQMTPHSVSRWLLLRVAPDCATPAKVYQAKRQDWFHAVQVAVQSRSTQMRALNRIQVSAPPTSSATHQLIVYLSSIRETFFVRIPARNQTTTNRRLETDVATHHGTSACRKSAREVEIPIVLVRWICFKVTTGSSGTCIL